MAEKISYRLGGWPGEDVVINVARSLADLDAVTVWLEKRSDQLLGLDLETNAVDPFSPAYRARAVQIADLHEAWVLVPPVGALGFDGEYGRIVTKLLREHPLWVAHFSENDIRFAVRGLPDYQGAGPIRLGDKTPHVIDSQVALALSDPRTVTTSSKKDRIHPLIPRLKGLKPSSERLLSPGLRLAEDALHARFRALAPVGHRVGQKMKTWGFAHIPDTEPTYLIYAGLDPIVCLRLHLLCAHQIEQRGQTGRLRAALIEQWMMDQATLAGLQVDGPYAYWLWDQLTDVITTAGVTLMAYGVAPSAMGPTVGQAFNRLGIEQVKIKNGKPCWDKDAIKILLENPSDVVRQLAAAVAAVRRATKFRSTYVAPMIRAVENGDGAMHCSVRSIGTVTTRMSAMGTATSGPLHQLPKKDTRIRAAVRAKRGHVLVSADFSQGEPFTMAALSGDEVYLADLMSGDINSTIAGQIYGEAFEAAYGKTAGHPSYMLRQQAKAAWLALCYGAQVPKFSETLAIAQDRGAEARSRLRGRYVKLWEYADRVNQAAVIELDSGGRVPLWDRAYVDEATGAIALSPRPSRLGLNAATQGSQADLLKKAMHVLNHYGWAWAIRFALHDELLMEVPEWMAETARLALEAAMTIVYRGVTIRCEAVIEGRTWLPQPKEFGALPEMEDDE